VFNEEKSAAEQRHEILDDPVKKQELFSENIKTFSEDLPKHKDRAEVLNKELQQLAKEKDIETLLIYSSTAASITCGRSGANPPFANEISIDC